MCFYPSCKFQTSKKHKEFQGFGAFYTLACKFRASKAGGYISKDIKKKGNISSVILLFTQLFSHGLEGFDKLITGGAFYP